MTIGPELDLDRPIPGTPTSSGDSTPAVASDGAGFLVVWEDRRNAFTPDIYGARIAADGTHLDPLGIPLVTDPEEQMEPSIAWNGSSYLLAWRDCQGASECFSGTAYGRIRAMRLSANGVPLDAAPLELSLPASDTTWSTHPVVASDGEGFLVVWQSEDEIRAARVTADGQILDPTGFAVSGGDHYKYDAAVASNGESYLVTWHDSDGGDAQIRGAIVVDGGVQAPGTLAMSAPGYADYAHVASDGTDYLVAWIALSADLPGRRVYANRVTAAGAVLDGAGLDLGEGPQINKAPAVAWNGDAYAVVWDRCGVTCTTALTAARVSSAGDVVDATPVELGGVGGENPAITTSADQLLVAWVAGSYGVADILAERVSPTLEVVAPGALVVSLGPNPQRGPVTVPTAAGAFVVWTDYRNATPEIYGLRITAAGEVLDPDGFRIAAGSWPSVATNGVDHLVAWSDGGEAIRAVRVSGAGAVLDAEPLTLKTTPVEDLAQAGPVVASAGGDYLVAWTEIEFPIPEIATPNRQVLGTIVTAAGEIRDPGGVNLDDGGRGSAPAIASNGAEYLLAWRDCRSGCPENLEGTTRAMRIGADGAPLDDGSIAFPERYASFGPRPKVASDGDGFLVVAMRGAARVSADGTVVDDTWTELEGLDADASSVAFGGGVYMITGDTYDGRVRGVRVSASGVALDPTGIALADGTWPALAYVPGASSFLVVYTRAYRNRARFVTP